MGSLFTFEKMKKDLGNTYMSLICIIVIMLLTTSCNTVPTKQTASTGAENTQEELECRYIEVSGSRFKRKICRTKETWAAISKKNRGDADELVRGLNDQSGISTNEGADSSGGRVNSPTTPF